MGNHRRRRNRPDPDDAVFLAAARARFGDLVRYAAAIVGPQEAEDVAQDALAKAWRYLHTFDGRGSFEGWLLRICRRCALDHAGRGAARPVELHGLTPPDPGAAAQDAVVLQLLVDDLPEHQREAFVLTQLIGLTYEETAAVLGVAVGTVRSRVARARDALLGDVGAAEAS